jgi:dienelactone hydrolase
MWMLAAAPLQGRDADRERALAGMQQAMGRLPARAKGRVEVEVVEETRLEKFTRRKILYTAEPGDKVPAYLLIPNQPSRSGAAVLCLHQTTKIGKGEPAGLGGNPNLHYAKELAERGIVTLAPDYPNFGDYRFDPYAHGYASATMKGIVNHMRGVDLLVSMAGVNRKRIGAMGHSLGGHNTLFVGAFDERIRAMATSCGFNSFRKYMKGDLTGWSHKGYMPRIASEYGKDPAKMPFDFPDILKSLAPRAVFINAPVGDTNFEVSGVRDCVEAAQAVYTRKRAAERLVAVYPQAAHEFPPAVREEAYRFLEKELARA